MLCAAGALAISAAGPGTMPGPWPWRDSEQATSMHSQSQRLVLSVILHPALTALLLSWISLAFAAADDTMRVAGRPARVHTQSSPE